MGSDIRRMYAWDLAETALYLASVFEVAAYEHRMSKRTLKNIRAAADWLDYCGRSVVGPTLSEACAAGFKEPYA